jgi:hypothetical protein
MTPCTQKLSAAKKKHFTKCVIHVSLAIVTHVPASVSRGTKPIQLFAQREDQGENSDELQIPPLSEDQEKMNVEEANPF